MFSGTNVEMTPDIRMTEICCRMGWGYYKYMQQPAHFIDKIWIRMNAKQEAQEYNTNND